MMKKIRCKPKLSKLTKKQTWKTSNPKWFSSTREQRMSNHSRSNTFEDESAYVINSIQKMNWKNENIRKKNIPAR